MKKPRETFNIYINNIQIFERIERKHYLIQLNLFLKALEQRNIRDIKNITIIKNIKNG